MTDQQLGDLLEYYLMRRPKPDEMLDAKDWLSNHPGGNLAEYVEAVMAL